MISAWMVRASLLCVRWARFQAVAGLVLLRVERQGRHPTVRAARRSASECRLTAREPQQLPAEGQGPYRKVAFRRGQSPACGGSLPKPRRSNLVRFPEHTLTAPHRGWAEAS